MDTHRVWGNRPRGSAARSDGAIVVLDMAPTPGRVALSITRTEDLGREGSIDRRTLQRPNNDRKDDR